MARKVWHDTDKRIEIDDTGAVTTTWTNPRAPGAILARMADGLTREVNEVVPNATGAARYVSTAGSDARDGLTPESAKLTLAAAIAALPIEGGTVHVGSGRYTTGPVALRSHLTILCQPRTIFYNPAGSVFTVPQSVTHLIIHGIQVHAAMGSCFDISASLSRADIQGNLWQVDGAAPAISATRELIETRWDVNVTGTGTRTEPLIKLLGIINHNYFTGRSNHSDTYVFHIEANTGREYASNNRIYDWNFEQPVAGCIRILSGHNNIIENVGIYDQPVPATADLVYLGKSPTSALQSRNNTIVGYFRAGGHLAPGVYDLKFEPRGAYYTTAINCTATTGFAADWGDNTGGISVGTLASTNAQKVVGMSVYGAKLVRTPKSSWFSPAEMGAGYQIMDETSNKVLTSDGVNWRDALGKIV